MSNQNFTAVESGLTHHSHIPKEDNGGNRFTQNSTEHKKDGELSADSN
jgi:hypothetical protein